MSVSRKDFGIGELKAQLQSMAQQRVTVGLQGRTGRARHSPDARATNAEIGAWHEYGTKHMPSRPFLRVAFDRHEVEMRTLARQALSHVIDGRKSRADAEREFGEALVRFVRETIDRAREWAAPLSESTVKIKGHGQPLVDSGKMRAMVSWAVRQGDKIIRQGGEE